MFKLSHNGNHCILYGILSLPFNQHEHCAFYFIKIGIADMYLILVLTSSDTMCESLNAIKFAYDAYIVLICTRSTTVTFLFLLGVCIVRVPIFTIFINDYQYLLHMAVKIILLISKTTQFLRAYAVAKSVGAILIRQKQFSNCLLYNIIQSPVIIHYLHVSKEK